MHAFICLISYLLYLPGCFDVSDLQLISVFLPFKCPLFYGFYIPSFKGRSCVSVVGQLKMSPSFISAILLLFSIQAFPLDIKIEAGFLWVVQSSLLLLPILLFSTPPFPPPSFSPSFSILFSSILGSAIRFISMPFSHPQICNFSPILNRYISIGTYQIWLDRELLRWNSIGTFAAAELRKGNDVAANHGSFVRNCWGWNRRRR